MTAKEPSPPDGVAASTPKESKEQQRKAAEYLASLVAPPPSGGWQPIETAPKDGTRFIGLTVKGTIVGDTLGYAMVSARLR